MMMASDFFDVLIGEDLDNFVSTRFEKICEQFSIRTFKKRTNEVILNIGRYWYNDQNLKKEIEINQCIKSNKSIYVYECKWTKHPVTSAILYDLREKGKELNADKFGAFSKSGFDNTIKKNDYDLIALDDLFEF